MKQPDSQKGELLLERGIALAEAGKPDELIQVADALRKLNGGPRHNSLFDAACFYGECAEMVVRGSTGPLTGEQESQRSRLVSQSLDALREAVEAGWYDMELIDTTTSLKLARSLPQYLDVKTIDPGDNRSQAIHRDIQTVESEIQRLTQQIKAEPLNAYLYRDRAAKYARLRNWRNALQDHDMFNTKSGRAMNRLGMLRAATQNLLAGNITQYREVCRQISSQFQGSPVPPEADVLCKSHLLLPGVNDTSKLAYQIIEKAVKQGQPDWFVPWGASTLALHAYRGGKWEAATNWTKSIDPHAWEQKPLAIGLAIQAMAEHRQGKPDKARQTLAKAAALIPADLRAMRPEETAGRLVPPLKAADVDWLIAEIFRREAEATLGGKTPEEYVNSWETNPSIEE